MALTTTSEILEYLKRKDKCFSVSEEKYGIISQTNNLDIFSSFIFHFISQMLSNKVADILWNRFITIMEEVESNHILKVSDDIIRSIGISKAKIEFIKSFCDDIVNRELILDNLNELSDIELIKSLTKIKGVGEWTAEMIALFNLERENIFSFKDVALKGGILKFHPQFKSLSKKRFEKLRKLYSPYCSYASLYFYKVNDDHCYKLD